MGPRKNRANQHKHGVSFEEAETIFLDDQRGRDQDHLRPPRPIRQAGAVLTRNSDMRKHYDFSKARRNPYAKRLKKQVTIRLEEPTLAYFKSLGERMSMPYQTLINLYLRDCAEHSQGTQTSVAPLGRCC